MGGGINGGVVVERGGAIGPVECVSYCGQVQLHNIQQDNTVKRSKGKQRALKSRNGGLRDAAGSRQNA